MLCRDLCGRFLGLGYYRDGVVSLVVHPCLGYGNEGR